MYWPPRPRRTGVMDTGPPRSSVMRINIRLISAALVALSVVPAVALATSDQGSLAPRPALVSAHGLTVRSTVGSFCVDGRSRRGTSVGMCADSAYPLPTARAPARERRRSGRAAVPSQPEDPGPHRLCRGHPGPRQPTQRPRRSIPAPGARGAEPRSPESLAPTTARRAGECQRARHLGALPPPPRRRGLLGGDPGLALNPPDARFIVRAWKHSRPPPATSTKTSTTTSSATSTTRTLEDLDALLDDEGEDDDEDLGESYDG